jgi:glyoxylase-like metal-dependent hydrolase (beta-lactamase superfamily II)
VAHVTQQSGASAPTPKSVAIEAPYTGDVDPDGPARQLDAGGATITKISVGPMSNNAYVVAADGHAVLIDAANDAPRLLGLLAQLPPVELIITTHAHADHWQALAEVAKATGAHTAAHALDAPQLPVAPDLLLGDGDGVRVGGQELGVIHLAGHTPGGLALSLPLGGGHLFTGDSLFPGGVGKTAGPAEFAQLLGDVQAKLFDRFGDDAAVYPGHGDDTTLGAERPHLGEWRARGW